MKARTLKGFQEAAVTQGLAVFAHAQGLLNATAGDETSQREAVRHHGCLLLEAPTGAGKTLMAGHLLERFAQQENVVWFWFAPFKGVVGQTADFLRGEFAGLRLRELQTDRTPEGVKPGDVYVATWQTVATRVKDRRNVRKTGELQSSVDELVASVRAQGWRLGVVVDEAHHGFGSQTQAGQFFREVLRPEYTVLITATPDDAEVEEFRQALGAAEIARTTISRPDVVATGLVKSGIRCVAYLVDEDKKQLVNLRKQALRDGVRQHRQIKEVLAGQGIDLTPLLLVQVDSSKGGLEEAREELTRLGFTEEQVAVHTAEEPDAGLLALANDEKREVLIFKMAVALGFDAPRAFTLVSMRAVKDEDFGVQLIGRILRVHRRLHGRAAAGALPETLRHGYVFLSDAEGQTGLEKAGQRINKLQTEYAHISPTTVLLRMSGQSTVQRVDANGQITFLRIPETPRTELFRSPEEMEREAENFSLESFFAMEPMESEAGTQRKASASVRCKKTGKYRYPLRSGVPRQFKSEVLAPNPEVTEEACAQHFVLTITEVLAAMQTEVKITERTVEIFSQQLELKYPSLVPDAAEAAWKAFQVLRKNDHFDPRRLKKFLLARLEEMIQSQGLGPVGVAEVERLLNLLLATHPEKLKEAQERAQAAHVQIEMAEPLPEKLEVDSPLALAPRNLYGCMPEGLNGWEVDFVQRLESDPHGKVLWWHRNEQRKDWSVAVVLENGDNFFPDFIIGVHGRAVEENALLADTKREFDTWKQKAKAKTKHQVYGRVLIITQDEQHRWRTVSNNRLQETPQMEGVMSVLDWDKY